MRLPSIKLLAVAVLALGSMGLVANQVFASVPTIKGKGGKVFQVVNVVLSPAGGALLGTLVDVPLKQTLVVTDVIVTNLSANAGDFQLFCSLGGSTVIMNKVLVGASGMFQHSFGQGIECTEGTKLNYGIGSGSAANWHITVTGYLRKGL